MYQKDLIIKLDQKDHSIEIDARSSPVKRTKAHVAKLQQATDGCYILDVVNCGYMFPFPSENGNVQKEIKGAIDQKDHSIEIYQKEKIHRIKNINCYRKFVGKQTENPRDIYHVVNTPVNTFIVVFNKNGRPRYI